MRPHSGRSAALSLLVAVSAVLLSSIVAPIAHSAESDAAFTVEWKLIENQPTGSFITELTLHNHRNAPLTGNWALYFNDAAKLLPASASEGLKLRHING